MRSILHVTEVHLPVPYSFSFGVTMWECYTSQRPFPGFPQELLSHAIIVGKRPEFPEGTPDEFKSLTEACWHGTASARPTFREIMATLTRLIRSEPGQTRQIEVAVKKPQLNVNDGRMPDGSAILVAPVDGTYASFAPMNIEDSTSKGTPSSTIPSSPPLHDEAAAASDPDKPNCLQDAGIFTTPADGTFYT